MLPMTKTKAIAAVVIVGVVASAGAWFFATPYLALRGIRKAADARDGATLAGYVDFPALQASLKTNLDSHLATAGGAATGAGANNALVNFGTALLGALAAPAIDALVTPETLSLLLHGKKPGDPSVGVTTDVDMSMGYSDANTFVVDVKPKGSPDQPIELVLKRAGLATWKLSSVRIP